MKDIVAFCFIPFIYNTNAQNDKGRSWRGESRGELVDFRMVLGSVASGKMRGVHARLFGGGEMGAA